MWSEGHHLYHSYWSMLRLLISEKSLLVIQKFLRLFLNTLSANEKYSLLNRDNLGQPIQMKLSQKQITLFQFVFAFLKSSLNFEHFQKKMLLIAVVLSKLRTPKNVVKQISKKSPFIGSFGKQHVRESKHCWNLNRTTFTIFIDHCKRNWVRKNVF